MKNTKSALTFLFLFLYSYFVSAQINDFRLQKISDSGEMLSPFDTLNLDKPFIKRFSGSINGKNTQIFLAYYLSEIGEEIPKYNYNLTLHIPEKNEILYGSLTKQHNQITGSIYNDDGRILYTIEYYPENSSITLHEQEKGEKITYNENLIYFKAYDRFIYNKKACNLSEQQAVDWEYELDFEPTNYPEHYTLLFSKLKNKELKKWKHTIRNNTETNNEEDFCFSTTKITLPLYLDQKIFEIKTFQYSYEGGAHGNYSTTFAVYDVKRAKKLIITDLINIKNKNLLSLYKQKLKEKYPDDLLFTEDFNQIKLSENFYILPAGIVFVHSLYSIAPYVAGEPSIFISFEDLKSFVRYNPFQNK